MSADSRGEQTTMPRKLLWLGVSVDPEHTFLYVWQPYAVAIALTAMAAALRLWPLQTLGVRLAWLTFYPAVIVAALYGGFFAGLLGTLLSCLTLLYLLPTFVGQPFIRDSADWMGMAVFFATCTIISGVSEAMRRARAREKRANEQLGAANIKLQREITERKRIEEEIRTLNEELEQRVAERTAELSKANETLQAEMTERKRAGMVLQEREQMLEALFEYSPDAIIVVNREGRITRVNKIAEELFGYKKNDLVDMTIETLVPERFRDQHGEHRKEYHLNARSRTMGAGLALHARRKDGTEFPVDIMLSPVDTTEGQVVKAVIRDITDRIRAEEELRNAEKRYRTTLDHMLEGCQIIGFDWRYLYINDVAAQQGRHSKEELLGHTMMEIYPGIENTQMFVELRRCMEERIPHRMENEFIFPDGSKGWFHLSMEPVPEGVFNLSEDITKEKQLDEELKKHREHLEELVVERTAELESANKELEAFSYSVSHDLRAPLRHVSGFVELLLKKSAESLDDSGKRYLSIIVGSIKEMGILIDDLLSFSRMGRTEMHSTRVNMKELVEEVVRGFESETQGRAIEWRIEQLPEVIGDYSMMRQTLVNLLSNALKYSRTREIAKIHVGAEQKNNEHIFFVRDNGVGFDMKYVEKLFGVFQRLHSSKDFEGTGIGLANVRRIIIRHGGRTWAEGELNNGATFYFSLPTN